MAVEGMLKCGVVGVGGGAVAAGDHHVDDMGDGMQCSDHPYRTNPGGICAFCLQEKLGKLVSSSFPLPVVRASSSSSASSPNSFRSDHISAAGVSMADASSKSRTRNTNITANINNSHHHHNVPFLLSVVMAKKKKKKVTTVVAAASSSSSSSDHVVFKRSKSTATPRGCRFLESVSDDFSPRKRGGGFWSFLHLSSSSSSSARNSKTASFSSATSAGLAAARSHHHQNPKRSAVESASTSSVSVVVLEGNDTSGHGAASPGGQTTSFERKVSRSRSVGCGSRSFSGDFFERISTGFGDCTLRRVESQREGKPSSAKQSHARDEQCMKERVRCGGLFGGFTLTSSSSSSSSYWDEVNGPKPGPGPLVHARTRSWGWAFASPIRAFTKPSGPNNPKRDNNNNKSSSSTTPNLAAIPSLLAVRG